MYSDSKSSDGKGSRDYSTAAPYIIPSQIMDQTKNLRSMIYQGKSRFEGRASLVDNYFVKSRYENASNTATRYELRPSLKPKIQNKLHLQLPKKQKVTVKRYIGQQKQVQQKVTSLFSKVFKCCVNPTKNQGDYQECNYCENRYYRQNQQQEQEDKNDTQPYISYKRLAEREKQPVQVFYQEITNQEIQGNRFGDDKNYATYSRINRSKFND